MSIETISIIALACLYAWLGVLCFFIGVSKFKGWSLKSEFSHEFILHQPIFILVLSFCLMFASYQYGQFAWLCVMGICWYLIYALWAMTASDFHRPWFKKVAMFFLFGMAICAALWIFGIRVNSSSSLAEGVYRLDTQSTATPARGELVGFCLARDNPYSELARARLYVEKGSCPNGLKPLLKKVEGLPGDQVEFRPEGIAINGIFLDDSIRPTHDSQGRDMPPSLLTNGTIPPGYALTLALDHPGSFDGRHYGLVPISTLKIMWPVFTFK